MRLEYVGVSASATAWTIWPLFVLPSIQAKKLVQRQEAEIDHLQTEQNLDKSVGS